MSISWGAPAAKVQFGPEFKNHGDGLENLVNLPIGFDEKLPVVNDIVNVYVPEVKRRSGNIPGQWCRGDVIQSPVNKYGFKVKFQQEIPGSPAGTERTFYITGYNGKEPNQPATFVNERRKFRTKNYTIKEKEENVPQFISEPPNESGEATAKFFKRAGTALSSGYNSLSSAVTSGYNSVNSAVTAGVDGVKEGIAQLAQKTQNAFLPSKTLVPKGSLVTEQPKPPPTPTPTPTPTPLLTQATTDVKGEGAPRVRKQVRKPAPSLVKEDPPRSPEWVDFSDVDSASDSEFSDYADLFLPKAKSPESLPEQQIPEQPEQSQWWEGRRQPPAPPPLPREQQKAPVEELTTLSLALTNLGGEESMSVNHLYDILSERSARMALERGDPHMSALLKLANDARTSGEKRVLLDDVRFKISSEKNTTRQPVEVDAEPEAASSQPGIWSRLGLA